MKRISLACLFSLLCLSLFSQTAAERIRTAFRKFEEDEQLKYAISSLYVINAKTGEVVFDKNSRTGLAPASTLKIITSVTAFELLGKDYRYKTFFHLSPGNAIYVSGTGDPTLGSTRYASTKAETVFPGVLQAAQQKGRKTISNIVVIDKENQKNIPSGWIYEDAGNYYGAAPRVLNWKENQYDIYFFPGNKEGDNTRIDSVRTHRWSRLINNCRTGKPGSGDNAYVYFVPEENKSVIEGTVPAGEKTFSIAASDAHPDLSFATDFIDYLAAKKIYSGLKDEVQTVSPGSYYAVQALKDTFYIHQSPPLDSIIYWFNRKSINLYGEALIRTLAVEKGGKPTTEEGVERIRKFWKAKGLDENELNLNDGSGLSPLNRVTTHAQVEILKYAQKQNWFSHFYEALPEYNGMKMKSGTISDVKGYCGYHTSRDGQEYIFSFLVNNYNGKTSGVVSKMFKVLDELK